MDSATSPTVVATLTVLITVDDVDALVAEARKLPGADVVMSEDAPISGAIGLLLPHTLTAPAGTRFDLVRSDLS